jgi:hypothetical protein
MTLKNKISISMILIFMTIIVLSCSHYDMAKKETKISKIGDDESHNNGQNCMNCHSSNGKGEGWFAVAGSVYKSDKASQNPNGKVFLFTEPNMQGTLKYTIEVDGKGNFYTTETIDFGTGLYPAHQNSNGNFKYMQSAIINGQCQSCHNVSTDKIWND